MAAILSRPQCVKLKSREVSLTYGRNLSLRRRIVLKFCIEYGGNTVMLCANFQDDSANDIGIMRE